MFCAPMPHDYEGKASLQFCSSDADITIRSSDNMTFRLHRANIDVQAGAFPASKSNQQRLPESAHVLGILFRFIYPQRHPKLTDVDFKTVEAVATAAEKYRIFTAMHVSQVRLREFLPGHAKEILNYAIIFNYPDLIDETAPLCARMPVHDMLLELPRRALLPWALYHKAWETIFETAMKKSEFYPSGAPIPTDRCSNTSTSSTVCKRCQISMKACVDQIRKITSLHCLEDVLQADMPGAYLNIQRTTQLCSDCGNNCHLLPQITRLCNLGIQSVRNYHFTEFLNAQSPEIDIFNPAIRTMTVSMSVRTATIFDENNTNKSSCTIH